MNVKQRAQTNVEFLVIIILVLVFGSVIAYFFLDVSTLLQGQPSDTRAYFYDLPLGLYSVRVTDSQTNITFLNNLDESIRINAVYVNNIDAGVSDIIISPEELYKIQTGVFTEEAGRNYKLYIAINYTLLDARKYILFNETDFAYMGIAG